MKTKTAKSRIVTASKPMDCGFKTHGNHRGDAAGRVGESDGSLATLGALSVRTAMGNGSRRLFGTRKLLGLFFARSMRAAGLIAGAKTVCSESCDRQCRLCFAVALWNGRDPILKERLFGLTGPEGNHGEDVKECYYYLDATPTHSYLKALYKYPQAEFPYARLVEENRRRGKLDSEFELIDSGVFDDNRYFDVFAEYAKIRRTTS